MEPLKWDYIILHRQSLGKASKLLNTCLTRDKFWNQLKDAHKTLKATNMFSEEIEPKVKKDMKKLFADIN